MGAVFQISQAFRRRNSLLAEAGARGAIQRGQCDPPRSAREGTDSVTPLSRRSSLAPVFRDQCGRLCPRRLYQCVLKPLIPKIRMLRYDQLEAGYFILDKT